MNELGEKELSLRDYAHVVARRKWIVVTALVVTIGSALGVSALQDPVYRAEAQMLVKTRPTGTIFDDEASAVDPVRAVQTEIKVLESQLVADRVRQNLGLTSTPPDVVGSSVGATDVVAVRVRSGDPTTARVVADAYVQAYIEIKREQGVATLVSAGTELQKKVSELDGQIEELDAQVSAAAPADQETLEENLASQRRILVDQQALFKQRLAQLQVDAALTTGGADLVREAELPTDPIEPTPVKSAILAGIVALVIGLSAALLVDHLDDTVRSSEELELAAGGLPVLAVVPVDPPPDDRPVSLSRPGDYAVEAYRSLRTGLQFINLDSEARILQVTSPLSGEGKTTTAANLAVVFAQAGVRVVLVDADLRKPRIHEVFGLSNTRGFTTALLGEPFQLVTRSVMENLDVIPSGTIPPNPSELLGGRQMRTLVTSLAAEYELVIFDSAPVLPVADSLALAAVVEGVVLVTQARRTSSKQVSTAVSQLRRVQAPILGTVLNRTGTKRSSGYGYGGYGGYGYGRDGGSKKDGVKLTAPSSVTDASASSVPSTAHASGGNGHAEQGAPAADKV